MNRLFLLLAVARRTTDRVFQAIAPFFYIIHQELLEYTAPKYFADSRLRNHYLCECRETLHYFDPKNSVPIMIPRNDPAISWAMHSGGGNAALTIGKKPLPDVNFVDAS